MRVLLIVFALVVGLGTAVNAQKQKVGHLDVAKLTENLPEKDSLIAVLEQQVKEKEQLFRKEQMDYQKKYQEVNEQWETLSDGMKQVKQADLQRLQEGLQNLEQVIQQDLAQAERDLMQPLQVKIENAIKKVAEANDFAYILDSSSGVAVYVEGGVDVYSLVAKELGISVE